MRKNKAVWLLPLAVMAVIWFFSSRPGEESSMMSGDLLLFILKLVKGMFPGISVDDWMEILSYPFRKLGHVTEFTALFFSFLFAMRTNGFREDVLDAFGLTFLYACSDEYHQIFVPDRAGRVEDVIIDCLLPGIIVLVCLFLRRCRRSKDLE